VNWREHIAVDPQICHGQPCIKGTRVMASVVLDNLAAGRSERDILADYPSLTREDVVACVAYAADLARDRFVSFDPRVA